MMSHSLEPVDMLLAVNEVGTLVYRWPRDVLGRIITFFYMTEDGGGNVLAIL